VRNPALQPVADFATSARDQFLEIKVDTGCLDGSAPSAELGAAPANLRPLGTSSSSSSSSSSSGCARSTSSGNLLSLALIGRHDECAILVADALLGGSFDSHSVLMHLHEALRTMDNNERWDGLFLHLVGNLSLLEVHQVEVNRQLFKDHASYYTWVLSLCHSQTLLLTDLAAGH
jgi:hypothetical protein